MKKNKTTKSENLPLVGNYTKGAIKEFEESIENEKDFLEKVDRNLNNPIN